MSDLRNIDELLKHHFDDFAPDAPDVWQGVEQGVGQAASASQGIAAAAKTGITLGTKIIVTVAAVAGITAGVVLYRNTTAPADGPAASAVPAPAVTSQAEKDQPANEVLSGDAVTAIAQAANPAGDHHARRSAAARRHEHRAPVRAAADEPKDQAEQSAGAIREEDNGRESAPEQTIKVEAPESRPAGSAENKPAAQPAAKGQQASPGVRSRETKPAARTSGTAATTSFPETEEARPIIPDVFTPDNNGQNDRFTIVIENEVLYYLVIKDLKGNEVFSSNDKHKTWDGINMKNGEQCPDGGYYYEFHYQFKNDDKSSYKPGKVFLRR